MLTEPKPFEQAVASIRGRRRLPTLLGSRDLSRLGPAIRNRALVLARVTEAEVLDKVDRSILRLVSGASTGPGDYTNPAVIRTELKQLLSEIDYQPDPERVGTISDLRTDARLNLIIDTESKLAQGRGQYAQASDPDSLAVFPAAELVRVESRRTPRGFVRRKEVLVEVEPDHWKRRWQSNGGQLFEGRMIARLDDPVWEKISRFGLPHAPFDFNSGMGTKLIKRSEALRLGVIERGDLVTPAPQETPEQLASVPAPEVGSQFSAVLQQIGFSLRDGMLSLLRA
jgi:hypothetical protein